MWYYWYVEGFELIWYFCLISFFSLVARRHRPDIGRHDMISAFRYQDDMPQTWNRSISSDLKSSRYRKTISFRCHHMMSVRNRHYDIIPTSTLRYHSDMNLQPEENQCDIRLQYHSDIGCPILVSDIIMIWGWCQFVMSNGWFRADIVFWYQLPISKIDIVMISWILISADIGFMSADMILYVGYCLATRESYYYCPY